MMSRDFAPVNLTHHFLIAMPGLNDELFGRSVVYICEHTPKGALGLIINKPTGVTLGDLFDRLDLPLPREELSAQPVLRGGPLQTERGFVLHDEMGEPQPMVVAQAPSATPASDAPASAVGAWLQAAGASDPEAEEAPAPEEPKGDGARPSAYASTLKIPGSGLELTTSRDVLEAVSAGAGPQTLLVTLGYSAWGEGQLESELADNAWLTVPADRAVLFKVPIEQRYEQALALLGVQPWTLAPGAGRA
jgi:putative transcriptional regulator